MRIDLFIYVTDRLSSFLCVCVCVKEREHDWVRRQHSNDPFGLFQPVSRNSQMIGREHQKESERYSQRNSDEPAISILQFVRSKPKIYTTRHHLEIGLKLIETELFILIEQNILVPCCRFIERELAVQCLLPCAVVFAVFLLLLFPPFLLFLPSI